MKKLIFGCTLILSGIMGFVGWVNACVTGPAYTSTFSYVESSSFTDWIIIILFAVMAVAGFVIAIKELKKN